MKKKFQITFFYILVLFLVLNILVKYAISNLPDTQIHSFNDDAFSAVYESLKWRKHNKVDVVFFGDSRTKYQIDTSQLTKMGISSYNLGVSGQFLKLWPGMIDVAINMKPKFIVLGLTVDDLFKPLYSNPARPIEFYDVVQMIKTKQPLGMIIDSSKTYLRTGLPIIHFERIMSEYFEYMTGKSSFEPKKIHHEYCDELKRTAYKGGYIILCENGDGVMTRAIKENDFIQKMHDIDLTEVNHQTYQYLKTVVKKVKEKGIIPLILLMPYYHKHFIFEDKSLQALDCPIINLSNQYNDTRYKSIWANNSHMNQDGRAFLTDDIYKSLKKITQLKDHERVNVA